MKNTIWRLIAGKLYLGDIAQKYLILRKKPQVALKYEYCPYCSNTFTKSTIIHIKGNSDPTRTALQARFYQLKPFLNFNPDTISSDIQNAYLATWCKKSILGSFHQRKLIFRPLQTPQPIHQS